MLPNKNPNKLFHILIAMSAAKAASLGCGTEPSTNGAMESQQRLDDVLETDPETDTETATQPVLVEDANTDEPTLEPTNNNTDYSFLHMDSDWCAEDDRNTVWCGAETPPEKPCSELVDEGVCCCWGVVCDDQA